MFAATRIGILRNDAASIDHGGWEEGPSVTFHHIAGSSDGVRLIASDGAHMGDAMGQLFISSDSGYTWTPITSVGNKYWWTPASSADGSKLVAKVRLGHIYTSSDYGATWVQRVGAGLGGDISSSSNGMTLLATSSTVYVSTTGGVNWTYPISNPNGGQYTFAGSACSSDGTKMVVTVNEIRITSTASHNYGAYLRTDPGYIFLSTNSGASWTMPAFFGTPSGRKKWNYVKMSADGTKIVATASLGSSVYVSLDSGTTWSERALPTTKIISAIAMSASGLKIIAFCNFGSIFTSLDSGGTWSENSSFGTAYNWTSIFLSADGSKALALGRDGAGAKIFRLNAP